MQRLERRAVRGHDTVPKGFEVALQVGQRSAQLVSSVGDELASHSLLLLDLAGHAIERGREGTDLVGPARSHANGVIALGDELRRVADLSERRRDPPSDEECEGDARQRRHAERGDEETRHALLEHRLRRRESLAVIDHELRERGAREREGADRENEGDQYRDGDRREGDLTGETPHRPRSAR